MNAHRRHSDEPCVYWPVLADRYGVSAAHADALERVVRSSVRSVIDGVCASDGSLLSNVPKLANAASIFIVLLADKAGL